MLRQVCQSIVVTFLLLPVAAAADQDRQMAACAVIENSVDRLACFDKLAADRGVAGSKVDDLSSVDTGKWNVRRETSKINDKEDIFLTLDADRTIPGRLGQPEHPQLVARCMSNRTSVLMWIAGHWADEDHPLTFRIDKHKAHEQGWGESNDHEWIFSPDPVNLLKEMATGSEMYFRIEPINQGPMEGTFDLRGLAEAMKPLQKACGWDKPIKKSQPSANSQPAPPAVDPADQSIIDKALAN